MLPIKELQDKAIELLIALIREPSFSGQESQTAKIISTFLESHGIPAKRIDNNILAYNLHFSDHKPSVLLNSHHDTVKVVDGWTFDPHGAAIENEKLYGLGANDAGASLVSLMATFMNFYNQELPFNLILAASAEEENFGPKGMRSLVNSALKDIQLGIVGEPTGMNMAIAEKGLLVIDAEVRGKSGHAARQEGDNAIYKAMKDIQWIENFQFEKVSELLGPNVISVTQISAGYQHNVIPDLCSYVIDLRVNELYALQEAFQMIDNNTMASLTARSFRNNPSGISISHPVVKRGIALGIQTYGSPTLSDQAHMTFPTIKMGPGRSERSHTPDEYVYLNEIREGIIGYIDLLKDFKFD